MKKLLFILMAMLIALSATACKPSEGGGGNSGGGLPGGGDNVTIEFFGWGDTAEQENYQTLINLFMDQNPGINVVYNAQASTTYMTSLTNRANNLPDIFYMPDNNFLEWAANGMLLDITDYVEEEDLDKLWPEAVNEYYFDADTYALGKSANARLYGLPKDLGPFTLVYNETLLNNKIAQYGLNKEEIYATYLNPNKAMTWNEFRTLLKMIDPDGGADGVYGVSHYEMEAAIYSNDANYFNEGATTQTITDKNFSDALQFIADLTLVDNVMPSAADQVSTNGYQRFNASGCVFSFMGPWDCAAFWKSVPFEWNVLPVAYNGENPNAVSTAWVGSMGYCLDGKLNPNRASDKAKIDAAIKLANFLCYDEGAQRKFYELGQQVPNITSMANDEYLNDTQNIINGKGPSNRSVWLDTINGTSATDKIGGKTRATYFTYSTDWYDMFSEHLTDVDFWNGTVTAAQACQSFSSNLQDMLDEMQAQMG